MRRISKVIRFRCLSDRSRKAGAGFGYGAGCSPKLAESQEVSTLLADIFSEEPQPEPKAKAAKSPKRASGKRSPSQAAEPTVRTVAGLDEAHSELLLAIAQKSEWQRAELEGIAAGLSLMLDGALEVINDAAF